MVISVHLCYISLHLQESELKKQSREMELQSREKLSHLKGMLEDREQQLEALRLSLETQHMQAEKAIDDFKTEVSYSFTLSLLYGGSPCIEPWTWLSWLPTRLPFYC